MITCTACKNAKSPDAFPRNNRTRNGRSSWCRECHNAYSRAWSQSPAGRVSKRLRGMGR